MSSIPSWNIDLTDQQRSTLQSAEWLKYVGEKTPLILSCCLKYLSNESHPDAIEHGIYD